MNVAWRIRLSAAASFCLAMAGAFCLLGRWFPFENQVSLYRAKAAQFSAHRDEYDTLFIGSSRVHLQLSPEVFDRTTRAAGIETHTFNYGLSGMFAPEDGFVCERIFAMKPKRLRQVFIELSSYFPNAAELNVKSARVMGWHDFRRTALICRELWPKLVKPKTTTLIRVARYWLGEGGGGPILKAWPKLALHLQFFFTRLANVGTGASWLGSHLVVAESDGLSEELGDRLDGYVTPAPGRSARLLAEYVEDLARLRSSPALSMPLPRLAQENLDGMLKLVRAAGAEPILFIAPSINTVRYFPSPSSGAPLLDFSDEDRWPELFRVERRKDIGHLDAAGAEIFTRDLATEWLKLVDARRKGGLPAPPHAP